MTETSPACAGARSDVERCAVVIEAYVTATIHAFAHAAEGIEGALPDTPAARRLLDRYVETLAGFALGIAAASMAHAARVWLGERADQPVIAALAALTARGPLRAPAPVDPFASESSAPAIRLHARTHRMGADLRALANAVCAEVAGERKNVALMFAQLGRDSLAAERFAREIERGWAAVQAVVHGEPHAPGSPLWGEWIRRVRGEWRAAPPPAVREHIAVIA
ncbi:MAG TPA: hypothetical protein VMJ10_01490 [Kofleriaceae bacterium]|nr:hypothetical protein [Kofleriaceae bacterium]